MGYRFPNYSGMEVMENGMDRLSIDRMDKVLSGKNDVHNISEEFSYRKQEAPQCNVFGSVSCF